MITDELLIQAPVATVWRLTTDVESWPRLTPTTMTSVERLDAGPLRVGSTARVKQPGQRPTVWTVQELEPERRFVWSATVYGVTMTARHELSEEGNGTRNRLSIEMTGRGAGLLRALVGRKIAQVIATENRCFAAEAEAETATSPAG